MPLLGQASGGFTESSSALRILHAGVRNSTGVLTTDAFTQTNPPNVTTAGTVSSKVDTQSFGVLSGSVCFARPDAGSNFIGGPLEGGAANLAEFLRPLGCFINSSNGNAFENLPGQASGKGPYMSAQGTYGNALYETNVLDGANVTGHATGDAINYGVGQYLVASRNGYLMPSYHIDGGGTVRQLDVDLFGYESTLLSTAGSGTIIGVLKLPPDAVQNELVYDQRI